MYVYVDELRLLLLKFGQNRGYPVTLKGLRKVRKGELERARWAIIHGHTPILLRRLFPQKADGCPPSPYQLGAPLPEYPGPVKHRE